MRYLVALTGAQIRALARWAADDAADVLIDVPEGFEPGTVYVGQGDARATISPDGAIADIP